MGELELYDRFRAVPEEAKKPITGGRLNGKTDINPMWRIKVLTEVFGPCGFGWRYEIVRKELCPGANSEIAAFVDIDLYVKWNDRWSEAIPGTGGSAFVSTEKSKLYTSDECFKMALTDAISVSCKALGVGADVYWDKDATKYDKPSAPPPIVCADCSAVISDTTDKNGKRVSAARIAEGAKEKFGRVLCTDCALREQDLRRAGEAGEGA